MGDSQINRYCTISEMAKFLRVSKHTILHYEDLKIISPIKRGHNNYRYYTGDQIKAFKHILYLRELGFSIKDIKKHLNSTDKTETLIQENLKHIDKEIQLLNKKRMELIKFSKQLEKKKLDTPFLKKIDEVNAIYTEQNSFEQKDSIKSFTEFDNILSEITWSEKYHFGFIISKKNLLHQIYMPEKFIVLTQKKEFNKKYIFKKSNYALLHVKSNAPLDQSIKKLLDWISANKYIISGDLFIQFISSYSFFVDNNISSNVKTLKIPLKNI
ncbi:MAG: MerR family transcriptional regulator [Clostridiales bacterium]